MRNSDRSGIVEIFRVKNLEKRPAESNFPRLDATKL